jgi:hypothetical protein
MPSIIDGVVEVIAITAIFSLLMVLSYLLTHVIVVQTPVTVGR